MKRTAIALLTLLALTLPRLAHAQFTTDEDNGPPPYNDVEDGQALRLAGYFLAPLGFALEWTVMRPLHGAATDSPLRPILSGDTDVKYFGETTNADLLPPDTFAPFVMPANPNAIESDATPHVYYRGRNVLPPVPPAEGYRAFPLTPDSQSAIH